MMFDIERWINEIWSIEFTYEAVREILENKNIIKRFVESQKHEVYNPENTFFDFSSFKPKNIEPDEEFVYQDYIGHFSVQELEELVVNIENEESSDDALDLLDQQRLREQSSEGRKDIAIRKFAYYVSTCLEGVKQHKRQVHILICTYFDLILIDFLQALFKSHPKKMHPYVGDVQKKGDGKITRDGKIKVNKVYEVENIESLLKALSEEAARNFIRDKKQARIFIELESLTKKKIDEEIAEKMIELLKIRNSIVHEDHHPSFSGYANGSAVFENDLVLQALRVLYDFLMNLGDIAFQLEVPQNYFDSHNLPASEYAEMDR